MGKAFSGKSFGKAALFPEDIKLTFHLPTYHHYKPIAEYQQAVGSQQRIALFKPSVKVMFLVQYVYTAVVQHIVFICRAVKAKTVYRLIRRIIH